MKTRSNKIIFIFILLSLFSLIKLSFAQEIPCIEFPDHPDDNYSVSSSFSNVMDYLIKHTSKDDYVAILSNGFLNDAGNLIVSSKQKSYPLTLPFAPSEVLIGTKTILIPSGGLSGLDNSQQFKDNLAQFVSNGGVLVALCQQHGYEYSALPGGEVGGYGWLEDQGCFSNALYIDSWHQVLSGQSSNTISASVDGYFTSYPDSTTVLLRRTKNNEPAMIIYPYGSGWVIATTMYEDWAYGHGQSTAQGRALIRDIISWAKKPQTLPEINPGQSVTIDVLVKNTSQYSASQVKFIILDPNRNKITESIQSISLNSGESIPLNTQYSSLPTSPLGIWWVNYELLDSNGNILQSQTEGERFVISNPPSGTQTDPNFMFWATSNAEQVTPGSNIVLTIWVKNNSDTDLLNASINVNRLHQPYQTINNVNVAAYSEESFTFSAEMTHSGMFELTLNDSNNIKLANTEKGIWVFSPSAKINISIDKTTYKKGENVIIDQTITNLTSAAYDCEIKTYILNPSNQKVFDTTQNINLSASGQTNQQLIYSLTPELLFGTYILSADVYKDNTKIGGNSVYFTIPGALVSITPVLPPVWDLGNSLSFNINNIGGVDLDSASLEVEIKNPDTSVVYSGTKTVTGFLQGTNQTVDFNISLPDILYGNYILKYVMSYENKIDGGIETILCHAVLKMTLDKVKYNILDEVQVIADLRNTGEFKEDGAVNITIPDFGFNQQNNILLLPFESATINYSIPIPDDVTAGIHTGKISFDLTSGSKIEKNIYITIPDYNLSADLPEGTFSSGDNLNVVLRNTGGIPINGEAKIYLRDSNSFDLYNSTQVINPLLPGGELAVNIQIPAERSEERRVGKECRSRWSP